MTHETTLTKNAHNGWTAKSQTDLGAVPETSMQKAGQRIVRLTTLKNSSGTISSRAACYTVSDWSETHAFGLGVGGDFSKQVQTVPGRATEKAVKEAHAKALEQFPAIIEEARAWYAEGKDKAGRAA